MPEYSGQAQPDPTHSANFGVKWHKLFTNVASHVVIRADRILLRLAVELVDGNDRNPPLERGQQLHQLGLGRHEPGAEAIEEFTTADAFAAANLLVAWPGRLAVEALRWAA